MSRAQRIAFGVMLAFFLLAPLVLYPEIGKIGVATRNPFAKPTGDDPGIVEMFDIPDN